jgi:hypothetical protein
MAKVKVVVEAVKRAGFPGYWHAGKFFPAGTPIEIEVEDKPVMRVRREIDPDDPRQVKEIEVEYLYKESELKVLQGLGRFLKLYKAGASPLAADVLQHGSPKYKELAKKAIDDNEEEMGRDNENKVQVSN